jgi:hypothetical protein
VPLCHGEVDAEEIVNRITRLPGRDGLQVSLDLLLEVLDLKRAAERDGLVLR